MAFAGKEGQTILELMKRGTLFYSNQQVPYMGSAGARVNINIGNTNSRKRKTIRYSSRKNVHKRKSVRKTIKRRHRKHRRSSRK